MICENISLPPTLRKEELISDKTGLFNYYQSNNLI